MFSEPKIGDLDMAVCAEEDVFRLQVAVDDVERVEVVERKCNLGGKELCDRIWEALREGEDGQS